MKRIRDSFAYDCLAVVGLIYLAAIVVQRYVELWSITHP